MTVYAGDSEDKVVPALSDPNHKPYFQLALSALAPDVVKTVGLMLQTNGPSIWQCPSRLSQPDSLPCYGLNNPQWDIGYQYLGGITTWQGPVYTGPSYSPVKLSKSKPFWCLAADAIVVDTTAGYGWGGGVSGSNQEAPLYENLPPHRNGGSAFPPGGNQVFCDGSARWIKIETMRFFNSFLPGGTRSMYFYQDSQDFTDPVLLQRLNIAAMTPQP